MATSRTHISIGRAAWPGSKRRGTEAPQLVELWHYPAYDSRQPLWITPCCRGDLS